MKVTKLNDVQLSELTDLTSHLANEIESYNHVSEFLPKSILNSILEYNTKLINEINRREAEEQERQTVYVLFGRENRQDFAITFTLYEVKNNIGEHKDTEIFYTLQENLNVFESAKIKPIEVRINRDNENVAMLKTF